jgi:hypothetical protein
MPLIAWFVPAKTLLAIVRNGALAFGFADDTNLLGCVRSPCFMQILGYHSYVHVLLFVWWNRHSEHHLGRSASQTIREGRTGGFLIPFDLFSFLNIEKR